MSLPTPEQERKAVMAVIALGGLTLIGAFSLLAAVVFGVLKLAKWWVFA